MDANRSSMGYVKLNKVWDTFPRDDRVQMGDWEGLPPSLFAFFFFIHGPLPMRQTGGQWCGGMAGRTRQERQGAGMARQKTRFGSESEV